MRLLLAAVATVVLVACAIDQAKIRELAVGHPPDFSDLDETYLQDAMWRLGHDVKQLDNTINAADLDDAAREQQVLVILDDMASAAAAANAPGTKQRHKNVAMNIDQLITDIDLAKKAAQAHDLGPAKALPQSCLACHQGGAGGTQKK